MSFWAPFVLVHLGGQDTITALSKQDNDLWLRHLLSLVSQVLVSAYVVAKLGFMARRPANGCHGAHVPLRVHQVR
jgi:hypothetical protein